MSTMGNREDLLAGARRCLFEKGYSCTTVRDIATAAGGVSMAAIGYHFGSKEALLNEALAEANRAAFSISSEPRKGTLVDEHLPDLAPFYAEAWRLAAPGARFVSVSFHPQFMMVTGMPTHYTPPAGEPVAINTNLHLLGAHVSAAVQTGWVLTELAEQLVDDAILAAKPKWTALRGQPFTMATVWTRPQS